MERRGGDTHSLEGGIQTLSKGEVRDYQGRPPWRGDTWLGITEWARRVRKRSEKHGKAKCKYPWMRSNWIVTAKGGGVRAWLVMKGVVHHSRF